MGMDEIIELASVKFGPVKACIYCGRASGELTSEHIFPLSLGGKIELLEASCSHCAKETTKLETYIGRNLWFNARTKLGFPTRRKKDRPDHLTVVGKDGQLIPIPATAYPALLPLLWFPLPSVLTGQVSESVEIKVSIFQMAGAGPSDVGVEQFEIRGSIDPIRYGRFIAKIAHGMAVLRLGLNGFDPVLNDIIVNPQKAKMDDLFRFVGSQQETTPPASLPQGVSHSSTPLRNNDHAGQSWICEEIQLFSNWGQPMAEGHTIGTPRYLVVIGKPKGLTPSEPLHSLHYPDAIARASQRQR